MQVVDKVENVTTAHPLLERLIHSYQALWVDTSNIDSFLDYEGDQVLFFVGDPIRFPEGLDVAVVLPELQSQFPNRFRIGIVRKQDENEMAARYAVISWPNLVFLRGKDYVGSISGMQDWDIYVQKVNDLLNAPIKRLPIAIHAVQTKTQCG